MDAVVARKMHRTLEVYHGMIYFVPEARAEYAALGLADDDLSKGYFGSRASAMGAVPAEVVIATFYNFHPDLVRAAVPSCWDVAPPDAWQRARRRGADAALRRMVGDLIDTPEVLEASKLAREATGACVPAGRPLFAGHASLDWPDAPHLKLWHAITLLREHRGDGHVAALVAAGITPIEALVLHDGSGEVPAGVLQATRAWSDDEWSAAREGLRDRGWMSGEELTEAGRAARDDIEHTTDELAMAPWRALGEPRCRRLRELVRPLSKAIVADGGLRVIGAT
jgi:hypothetical protein